MGHARLHLQQRTNGRRNGGKDTPPSSPCANSNARRQASPSLPVRVMISQRGSASDCRTRQSYAQHSSSPQLPSPTICYPTIQSLPISCDAPAFKADSPKPESSRVSNQIHLLLICRQVASSASGTYELSPDLGLTTNLPRRLPSTHTLTRTSLVYHRANGAVALSACPRNLAEVPNEHREVHRTRTVHTVTRSASTPPATVENAAPSTATQVWSHATSSPSRRRTLPQARDGLRGPSTRKQQGSRYPCKAFSIFHRGQPS